MAGDVTPVQRSCHWPSWPVPFRLDVPLSPPTRCPYLPGREMRVRGFLCHDVTGDADHTQRKTSERAIQLHGLVQDLAVRKRGSEIATDDYRRRLPRTIRFVEPAAFEDWNSQNVEIVVTDRFHVRRNRFRGSRHPQSA